MSSTPLFDAIARRTDVPTVAQQPTAALQPSAAQQSVPVLQPVPSPAVGSSIPTSPLSAPSSAAADVPCALISAIDAIPSRMLDALPTDHVVCAEQLVLVEAVADAITRAVVDAVAIELERITRDGVVRS